MVPSANFVPIWVNEGLLLESRPDQMENFKNVDPVWADVDWDPGRHYTVPWQWGTTGVVVNTKYYKGDIDTSAIFMDPPDELVGKINVVPEMGDVMGLAIMYYGGKPCTDDKELLKKVRDGLVAAKPKWLGMDYGNIEKFAKEDLWAGVNWIGSPKLTIASMPPRPISRLKWAMKGISPYQASPGRSDAPTGMPPSRV